MAAYKYYYDDYGTSPRKLDPIPSKKQNPTTTKKKSTNKKSNVAQRRTNYTQKAKRKKELELKKQKLKTMLFLGVVFGILFAISYRYSLINEHD